MSSFGGKKFNPKSKRKKERKKERKGVVYNL